MTVGADDESAARVQKADADDSNVVQVQAHEIHGDIHLALGHDRRVLGLLNPYTEALQVAALAHDDAAKLLAAEPVPVSGRVVAALLAADYNLAVSLLGSINRHRAEELVVAAGAAAAGLEDLPEAAEAITECAARMRFGLGTPSGRLERAGASEQGTEGFWREFEHGGIHWSARVGAQATTGSIAEYHGDMGGSRRRLGFPLSSAEAVHGSFPETTGLCQRFESSADYDQEICGVLGLRCGATVYWSEMHGAHATWGPIGEFYERAHGPAAGWAFPSLKKLR